jgi:hypothetical protein
VNAIQEARYKLSRVAFGRRLLSELYPWQEELLRSRSKRVILNTARQSGKSTTTAIIALHRALFDAGSVVLIVSPTLRQSSELFTKVMAFYRDLGRPRGTRIEQRTQVELMNGSRIISLPGADAGASIRGYTASLLIVDEAARVEDRLFHAIRPMLAVSEGTLIMLSTPRGRMGAFYQEYEFGGPVWERYHVTADEIPLISPEFLEQERITLPPAVFRQEYYGEFIAGDSQFFTQDEIDAMVTDDVEPFYMEVAQ